MESRPELVRVQERPEGALEAAGGSAGPRVAADPAARLQGGALAGLRALHHALARAEAEGRPWPALAALASDLTRRPWGAAEVERLTRSPAFRELVASYKRAA